MTVALPDTDAGDLAGDIVKLQFVPVPLTVGVGENKLADVVVTVTFPVHVTALLSPIVKLWTGIGSPILMSISFIEVIQGDVSVVVAVHFLMSDHVSPLVLDAITAV